MSVDTGRPPAGHWRQTLQAEKATPLLTCLCPRILGLTIGKLFSWNYARISSMGPAAAFPSLSRHSHVYSIRPTRRFEEDGIE